MQELANLAKVFSDINRLKILALLVKEKKVCVCELCDTLNLSQPLVSRHLKLMRQRNIVDANQNGKWVIYSLSENSALDYWITQAKKHINEIPSLVVCNRQ